MITYPTGVYGFRILFRLHGSAVFKSLTPALLSSVIYLVLWYTIPGLTYDPTHRMLDHPYTVGALVSAFTFLLAFRANFSYNRYWEAMSSVFQMHSKWLDVGTQMAAFHLQSNMYERQKPPTFAARPDVKSLERERERIYEPTPEEFLLHIQALEEEQQQSNPLTSLRDQMTSLIHRNRANSLDVTEDRQSHPMTEPNSPKKHRSSASMPLPSEMYTISPAKTFARKTTFSPTPEVPSAPTSPNDNASPHPLSEPSSPLADILEVPTTMSSPLSAGPPDTASSQSSDIKTSSIPPPRSLPEIGPKATITPPPPSLPGLSPMSTSASFHRSALYSYVSFPPPPPPIPLLRTSSHTTESISSGAVRTSFPMPPLPSQMMAIKRVTSEPYKMNNLVPPPAPSIPPPKSKSINAHKDDNSSSHRKGSKHDSNHSRAANDVTFDMEPTIVTTKTKRGGLESDTPALFLQEAAHLLSLLSAVAMSTLRNDLEEAETPLIPFTPGAPWPHVDPDSYSADIRKGWTNSTHRSWTILQYLLGLTRTDASRTLYNAARPFRVIGGVSDAEIQVLQSARGPMAKVALCSMWLQEFMTREHLAGSMGEVAPPIISRLYQSVSDGMLAYNQARKVVFIPFPFPHAQITSLFVLVIVGFTPVLMLSFVKKITLGFLLNLLTVMCFTGLHEVARELESPFQNIPNDIPANNIHVQYNEGLMTMFHGYHPDAFWQIAQVPTPRVTQTKGGTHAPTRKMYKGA